MSAYPHRPFERALAASLRQRAASVGAASASTELGTPPFPFSPAKAELSPRKPGSAVLQILRPALFHVEHFWSRITTGIRIRQAAQRGRRLRVLESVPLGEKRFAAILSVQNTEYLIGHGPGGVSLLARLDGPQPASFAPAASPRHEPAAQAPAPSSVPYPLAAIDEALPVPGTQDTSMPAAAVRAPGVRKPARKPPVAPPARPTAAAAGLSAAPVSPAPVSPAPASPAPASPRTRKTTKAPLASAARLLLCLGLALAAMPSHAAATVHAAPQLLAFAPVGGDITVSGLGGSSASWTIVVLLTFLTLIPSILLCVTPFARLLIVFHFLRQALGLQTTPSNQTLIGLSMILTFFLMQPVGEVIYRDSVLPLQGGKITALEALSRAGNPMREFMSHYVRDRDVALFLEMAKEPRPHAVSELSFRVLLPSYILSELKAGFQIGTVLFLPFLVVDMVVASITTSVGMMQLPPVVISTPLKLLLFLMVDGWHLLVGSLMRSFH